MHHAVLLREAVRSLELEQGKVVLDATLGAGGHAEEILKRITPGGRLIGIDSDADALTRTAERLARFEGAYSLHHDNFRNIGSILLKEQVKGLDAALFDIGISSYQIEEGARGFSIQRDGPLDMRMDRRLGKSAFDIVNGASEETIRDILARFGEERFYGRIARRIGEERSKRPIETTHELAEIVRRAAGGRHGRIDPATRTFQALRIAVNDELGALEEGLKETVTWLNPGARISVISFHSLEDRIVKQLFRAYAGLGIVSLITKKPVRPAREEETENPRARSAKLRVAERI